MRYTVSFVVFVYVASAAIDVILGIDTLNIYESYLFRIAAVTTIIATYIHLISRGKPLRPLPFIVTSLALSITIVTLGNIDATLILNTILKVAAIILTLKPETIEVEITTEEEEENPQDLQIP